MGEGMTISIFMLGVASLSASIYASYCLGNMNGAGYVGSIDMVNGKEMRRVEACFQTREGNWNLINRSADGKGPAYWTESPDPLPLKVLVKKMNMGKGRIYGMESPEPLPINVFLRKTDVGKRLQVDCRFVRVGTRKSSFDPNEPNKPSDPNKPNAPPK